MRRSLLLLAAVLLGTASAAPGQARARVAAKLQGNAPEFWVSDLLDDANWLDMLDHSFPIVLHWRIASKKDAIFGGQVDFRDWCATLRKDPVLGEYILANQLAGLREQHFNTLDSLKTAVGRPLTLPLVPRNPGDYYYDVNLTIEAIPLEKYRRNATGACTALSSSGGFFEILRNLGRATMKEELPRATTAPFSIRQP